jgi:selenoprotein W-related protein
LAASISKALGVDSTLIEGSNGIFDVVVDDEMIFSKYESGRFPEDEEVVDKLRAYQAQ